MYAIIMTEAKVTSTFALGASGYTRAQNAYNIANVMVVLEADMVAIFEDLAGVELREQGALTLN